MFFVHDLCPSGRRSNVWPWHSCTYKAPTMGHKYFWNYSKALIYTVFYSRNIAQNLCNLSYLNNWVKGESKIIKTTCISRFSLQKYMCHKIFWTQIKTIHLKCPFILRPYCTFNLHAPSVSLSFWVSISLRILEISCDIEGIRIGV